jgi:predicted Zn-dependent peptidase
MIQKTTLDNGIRVLTEQMPGVHSVTLGVWVLSGSRNEPSIQNGISHFVEHMLFKGTKTRSARDVAHEIDSVGGVLNAFTSREYCCFHAKILADKLSLAIDLLADIFLNSVLDLDEMEKERRVILQEILMIEDDPGESVHDLYSREFWQGHPLGWPISGTADSVDQLSCQELVDYIDGHFCGDNLLICAAGSLTHEDIVRQVSAAFGLLKSNSVKKITIPPEGGRGFSFNERDLAQVHLCLGTPALSRRHPQRFVSFLLNTILGGSMSCRLFQKIREEHGLAYSIYSYLNCYSDAGGLVVYSATSYEHASKVVSLILQEMRLLKKESVSDQELLSAKEQLKGRLLLSLESSETRMMRLAKNEIYLGHHPDVREIVDAFDRISSEDVLQLANELFRDNMLNLQMVGPTGCVDFPLSDLTLG